MLFIPLDLNGKVIAAQADILIGKTLIRQLINGVGGIGNNLAQEDLLVRINGVDHQIQKALGFRLKLFFGHAVSSFILFLSTPFS